MNVSATFSPQRNRPAIALVAITFFAFGVALCSARPALAQEPINADSATQPSPGHVTFKNQFRYYSLTLDDGPRDERRDVRDVVLSSTATIGVLPDLSLSFRVPVMFRREQFDLSDAWRGEEGVGDVTALAKWRVWRNDSGPLDTQRLSLLGGAEIRSGDHPFTNDAYNPVLGLAYTQISGRHGVNLSPRWVFTTDGSKEPTYAGMSVADLFCYDLAYLYRLAPAEYDEHTAGAWYVMAELNGLYETNGDNELFLSPGLMYEAATWALELSVQVPVWQDLANRPRTEIVLVGGVRVTF